MPRGKGVKLKNGGGGLSQNADPQNHIIRGNLNAKGLKVAWVELRASGDPSKGLRSWGEVPVAWEVAWLEKSQQQHQKPQGVLLLKQ